MAPSAGSSARRTSRRSPTWQKIPGLLRKRGYSEEDVANIAHGNFLRFLRSAWS